ncbi:MAG: TonB-dependent receptor [Allosphingosinicella sp.]|uniref:TonB-dependent receptor domain-containing protein n=1 Tax=Allosphingosinicella sp. TaxID=2823234 RepID=UPI0039237574
MRSHAEPSSRLPRRALALAGTFALLFLAAAPAVAQRANENAVTSAGDAFGSSVGNERVGIYNPGTARGFSPTQAGNIRIEGLYFDSQADLDQRLTGGVSMRVGISAQSYPFSSPTGIADFALRKAGDQAVLSTILTYGPYGTLRAEADGQLPVGDTLSVAAGLGVGHDVTNYGADRTQFHAAVIPRWRPSADVEVMPFFSYWSTSGTEAQPIYFTGGSWLPPQIARKRFYGPDWAENETKGTNMGLVSTVRTGGWTLRGGIFRSVLDLERTFTELALNTDRQGVGDRFIQSEADRRFASTSGELRASRSFSEGPRLHTVHLALRGRDQTRRYGGGALVPLGRLPIDQKVDIPRPPFTLGPQSFDEVRQLTGGVGYETRWRDVGEFAVSVQKTDYRKSVETPAGPLPVSRDDPWLLNATLALHASSRVTFYAGYARGLEESPVAPAVARNRDFAPPAIITRQMDAGVRLVLPRDMRLVAGVFDVRKPYFGLDNSLLFRELGAVRHRGVELSLAGQPLPGLTAIVGTVFLDASLSGDAVAQGLVGRRPVGTFVRYTNVALDYRVPFAPGLSFDLNYESTSDRVADRLNTHFIPERYVVALGARYRFRIAGAPSTLRAQVGSVNDNYGWVNIGEGFHYNLPRRFSLSLSTDW